MRLKDVELRNAKSRGKAYRLNDGMGLYLSIHPKGGKYWQFRFAFGGKEKLLSLGVYPEVSLLEARDRRDDARKVLRDGKDPADLRKLAKQQVRADAENRFEEIACEWHKNRQAVWTKHHATTIRNLLERDVFPSLGSRPIAQIMAQDVLKVLRKMESRGVSETVHRTQQFIGQIFRYAVATGRAERDITADLRGALKVVKKVNHARLSANELPEFLQRVDSYDGEEQTKNAVKLLLLTFVRTRELREAKKSELNLQKGEWRIPKERMKMRIEHVVPLSRQATELFRAQMDLTGDSDFVFPNRTRSASTMSENTILYAIYRMGYHSRTTAHGFRSTASTILHEMGFNTDFIERQLAHRDKNAVRSSYNHAVYLPERRQMMQ